jgi:asparagine synthase (glutamine-hydrolysing)
MCGIAGLVGVSATVEESKLRRLVRGIAHRGPDDQGTYLSPDQRCGLGHARLSIIDLSESGHQPMIDRQTGNAIVFNGEIYNFAELRRVCEDRGYRFLSHTDTEVILALYCLYDVRCLSHLRGMFAFAIWDEGRQRLFFARDRVGKKPFHYSHSRKGLVFCSEIDPLSRHPWVDRELDLEALDFYLQLQTVPAPWTIYRGIRKLLPAHYGLYAGGQLTIKRYWQPDYRNKIVLPDEEVLEAFEEKLVESVRLRMVADVPVGALLSGGVDSSLVVAIMAREAAEPVHTFSVGFGESRFDETRYSMQAADICGTVHRPVHMETPDLEQLSTLVRRYGEPYGDHSALPSFLVCSSARQEVTVVMNGDGGDELLGGYPRYELSDRAIAISSWLQGRLAFQIERRMRWLLSKPAFPFKKLHRILLRYGMADAAPLLMYQGVGGDEERQALMGCDTGGVDLSAWRRTWLRNARGITNNPIDSMLWLDNQTYLPDDLLVKMDIAAMQCGLEARSPFLDHELIEFCARLPIRAKVRGGIGKYLIKKLAERYFPYDFVHRRKMGFGIPLDTWLRGPMYNMVRGTLLDPVCMAPLDHERVRRRWAEFDRGAYAAEPLSIWVLLMYGLWRKHCYLD